MEHNYYFSLLQLVIIENPTNFGTTTCNNMTLLPHKPYLHNHPLVVSHNKAKEHSFTSFLLYFIHIYLQLVNSISRVVFYTRPVYESVVYLDQVGRVGLLPVRAAALFDEPSFGFIAATTREVSSVCGV